MNNTAPVAQPTQWQLLKKDVADSACLWRLWTHLGWADILKQYRRSALGPLWISINSALFIVLFGLIGAQLFKLPVETYLPYFCLGHIVFSFFASLVTDGCQTYIAAEAFLKQTPYPKSAFVLRVVWRNLLLFLHNLPVGLAVLWWSGQIGDIRLAWLMTGLAFVLVAGALAAAILGAVAARFRDVPMLVASLMQIAFFVTPVMWRADQLTERARQIVLLNPLAAFLELLRAPMLGQAPQSAALIMAGTCVAVLAALWLALYLAVRRRIVYWV